MRRLKLIERYAKLPGKRAGAGAEAAGLLFVPAQQQRSLAPLRFRDLKLAAEAHPLDQVRRDFRPVMAAEVQQRLAGQDQLVLF